MNSDTIPPNEPPAGPPPAPAGGSSASEDTALMLDVLVGLADDVAAIRAMLTEARDQAISVAPKVMTMVAALLANKRIRKMVGDD